MPRESQASKRERLGEIIAGLQRTYPDAHCELNYRNPLQLMVATILSAQCTDKQVNIVTRDLFKKYRKAADYPAVPLEELQNDIRRIGLFRNKARKEVGFVVSSRGDESVGSADALHLEQLQIGRVSVQDE